MNIPAFMVKEFFDFCVERHSIYVRRFVHQDPWPWTADPILKQYKFTNIFRELDTGTIYCRKFIREPYAEHTELFFNIGLYRLHNRVETQRFLGNFIEEYNKKRVVEKVRQYRDVGNTVFTGAYMITSQIDRSQPDKIGQIFGTAAGYLWEHRRELEPQPGDSLEIAFDRLHGHSPGMGAFNAYELVTDLRHTRYLENAPDIMTWANTGPGAKRGIHRIVTGEAKPKKSLKPEQYLQVMLYLLEVSKRHVPKWFPIMEMRDIEHSLCEFYKYIKAKRGEGRLRGKFTPPHLR